MALTDICSDIQCWNVRRNGDLPVNGANATLEECDMERQEDPYVYFPIMTVPEAARYMGVSRKTVYMLIEFGEIMAVRERGAVRVEKRSLDEFRASGKLT